MGMGKLIDFAVFRANHGRNILMVQGNYLINSGHNISVILITYELVNIVCSYWIVTDAVYLANNVV